MIKTLKNINPFRDYSDLSGIEKAGFLIGFLLVENNISALPNIGALYYVAMFIAFFYLQSKQNLIIATNAMTGLYIACILSIIGNTIPSFLSPCERFITFSLITALVSPWLINNVFVAFRIKVLITIMQLLQFVILISFVYALMGKGYTHVYFQGVTNHSMMLGPFSALCALYSICNLINSGDDKGKRIWHGLVLVCALFCLLQAASRVAFLGMIFAVIMFFTVYYHNALGKYFKLIVSVTIMLVCLYPIWGQYMDKLEQKNTGETSSLNTNSRENHWEQRIVEFKSSPIIGVGFCSIATSSDTAIFDINSGKIETGSSWLSLLSMTGIIGFIFFLSVYLNCLKKAWKLKDKFPLLSGFLVALICFWTCHMMAEGYVLAGGNSLAFCMWLTLGVIYGVSSNEEYADSMQSELAQ